MFRILKKIHLLTPVLWIRIHMFLGLLDPDPLVRGMDPDSDQALDPDSDPDPTIIKKNSKKNLDLYCFVNSF